MASIIPRRGGAKRFPPGPLVVSTPDSTLGMSMHEIPDAIADAQRALGLSDQQLANRAGVKVRTLRKLKQPSGYIVPSQRPALVRILAYLEGQL